MTEADSSGDSTDSSAAASTYDSSAASSTYAPDSAAATSTYTSTEPTGWGAGSGYPEHPTVVQPDLGIYGGGSLTGYFFNDSSLAVLSIPSFQETGDAIDTLSSTVRQFLHASKAAGMRRVLIDLQQNYGGDTLLAFDTFKQFFPQIDPYGGSWLRAHAAGDVIGEQITTYWNNLTTDYDDYFALLNNEWLPLDRLNAATDENFTSWHEFYGPHQFDGDNFTTVVKSPVNSHNSSRQ